LAKAFEKHDETEVETAEVEAAPEVDADLELPAAEGEEEAAPEVEAAPEAEDKPGRERGADGKFAKKADAATEQKPIAKAAAAVAAAEAAPVEEPPKPAAEVLKAPSSLKAQAREAFAKAPRELQEDVIRIDKEVRQVMQQSAEARKFEGAFREMITPYVGLIRSEQRGRAFNPLEAISAVMDTAVALRTGQPGAKADLIGEMVNAYGVPPDQLIAKILKSYRGDMKQLDESVARLMEGHAPSGAGQQPAPQDFRDPRLDQFIEQRDQEAEERKRTLFAEKKAEVEAFAAKNEWYEDVRADMGRLFAVAKEANEAITLQEAYDTALALPKHKGIQGILGQRAQAAAIAAKKKAVVKARNAGSSVRGSPTGTATPEPATNSRRASIESAMSENDR
jgi:hypothetical protein